MSSQEEVARVASDEAAGRIPPRLWLATLGRAIVALIVAGVITFSPDHSAGLGFAMFGAFVLATAIVVFVGAIWSFPAGANRSFLASQAIVSAVAGIVALALPGGGLPFLIFILSAWAAISGFLELYVGLRNRRSALTRDWIFAGATTALFAIAVLIVPPDLNQPLGGVEAVEGTLTASVVVVGALGAYAALLGVYLVIAALSMKWTRDASANRAPEGSN
jgi:uncharacterized membrane protein HdeD (DUF308 family)